MQFSTSKDFDVMEFLIRTRASIEEKAMINQHVGLELLTYCPTPFILLFSPTGTKHPINIYVKIRSIHHSLNSDS